MSNHTDILNVAMLSRNMTPVTFTCECCNERDLPGKDLADLDAGGFYREEIIARFGEYSLICTACASEMSTCDKCERATPDFERVSHQFGWNCLCGECAREEQDADYLRHERAAEVSA